MKHLFTVVLFLTVWTIIDAQIFVKHDAAGTNDGTSWTNAFTDLQDALSAAIAGDQIWIASGTYSPDGPTPDSSHFVAMTAVEIYGGFDGTEITLTQRDWLINTTIISGDKNGDDVTGQFTSNRTDNAHHVMIVDAADGTCVIDGLTFLGGMTRIDALTPTDADILYNRWRGGAMYIRTPALVRNSIFRDNYGYQGSGLYALRAAGPSIQIENSIFESNSSVGGGSCYISTGWDAVVRQCAFLENQSSSFGGGLVMGNSNALVRECHFESNQAAAEAGGFMLFQNSFLSIPDPVISIQNCTFLNNVSAHHGGAIGFNIVIGGFTMMIDSCDFTGNSSIQGGALRINDLTDQGTIEFNNMVLRIRDTDFSMNSGRFGGAVSCVSWDDSLSIDISNTSFLSNYSPVGSTGAGGGMYVSMFANAAIDARFSHVEFVANQVTSSGAGLYLANGPANGRLHCDIESTAFINNIAESYAGALEMYGVNSHIQNSTFTGNLGIEASGAFDITQGEATFKNCLFSENSTQGTYPGFEGGGAGIFWGGGLASVYNSIFEENTSDADGAAILGAYGTVVLCDNVLFRNNHGNSTYENISSLSLLNTTMVGNEFGLSLKDSSVTEIQNSIFMNSGANLNTAGFTFINSKGGNLSSDASMTSVLTGFAEYADLHETDPLLGPDFVPLPGSPAIDAGNAEGVTAQFDLADNPRISGKAIDIGSYESLISATKNVIWNDPGFTIFPNPVIETLNFELDMKWIGEFNLSIYNYLGQQVYQTPMHKSDKQQSFRQEVSLSPGQYVLVIQASEVRYAVNLSISK